MQRLPYLLLCVLPFYLLPPFGGSTGFFIIALLLIMPLCCFLGGFLYTAGHPFCWYFPVLVGAFMLPTIWIFYNESAWIYVPAFAAVNLLGCLFGLLFRRGKDR